MPLSHKYKHKKYGYKYKYKYKHQKYKYKYKYKHQKAITEAPPVPMIDFHKFFAIIVFQSSSAMENLVEVHKIVRCSLLSIMNW